MQQLIPVVADALGPDAQARPVKLSDLICWRSLACLPCLTADQDKQAQALHAVVVPIPPGARNHGRKRKQQQPMQQKQTQDDAHAQANVDHTDAKHLWQQLLDSCHHLANELTSKGLGVHVDEDSRVTPGAKFHKWEGLGVLLRLEVGVNELKAGTACLAVHPAWRQQAEQLFQSRRMTAASQQQADIACTAVQQAPVTSGDVINSALSSNMAATVAKHGARHSRVTRVQGVTPTEAWELCQLLVDMTKQDMVPVQFGNDRVTMDTMSTSHSKASPCSAPGQCLGRCHVALSADLVHQEHLDQEVDRFRRPDLRCTRVHLWPGSNRPEHLWSSAGLLHLVKAAHDDDGKDGMMRGGDAFQSARTDDASPHVDCHVRVVCIDHVRHVMGMGQACHCHKGHMCVDQVVAEVEAQVVVSGRGRVVGWTREGGDAANGHVEENDEDQEDRVDGEGLVDEQAQDLCVSNVDDHDDSDCPGGEHGIARGSGAIKGTVDPLVTLVVTSIPNGLYAAQVRTALGQAVAAIGEARVYVPSGHGGQTHGWARIRTSEGVAQQLMVQLNGMELQVPGRSSSQAVASSHATTAPSIQLVTASTQTPSSFTLHVSPSCGRKDSLFSNVNSASIRSRLRVDATASYSVTDATTANAMAGAALAVVGVLRSARDSGSAGVRVVDGTACSGGNAIAMAHVLGCGGLVTAIELDRDRAADLLLNIRLLGLAPTPLTRQACIDDLLLDQDADASQVRVLCGDFTQLWAHLGPADCVMLDPPWGGPAYSKESQPPTANSNNQPMSGCCPSGPGLVLGTSSLCSLCGDLLTSGMTRSVALKLPASGASIHTALLMCMTQHASKRVVHRTEASGQGGAPECSQSHVGSPVNTVPVRLWAARVLFGRSCLLLIANVSGMVSEQSRVQNAGVLHDATGSAEEREMSDTIQHVLRARLKAWAKQHGYVCQVLGVFQAHL